jgi:hypothetical protein
MKLVRRSSARGVLPAAAAGVLAGTLVVALGVSPISSAWASGSFPGNQTAVPPAPIDTGTACPPASLTNPGFTDVDRDFFRLQIYCAADYGVTDGTSATTYAPTAPVLRDQMAAFFYRLGTAAGHAWSTAAPATSYTDAAGIPQQFRSAVDALTNAGMVSGYADGSYAPDAIVSRGEMSKFIYNALKVFSGATPAASGQDYFADDDGGVFENPYLNAVAGLGLFVGAPGLAGGTLSNQDQGVQRDEMAGFLARLIELGVEQGWLPNRFVSQPAVVTAPLAQKTCPPDQSPCTLTLTGQPMSTVSASADTPSTISLGLVDSAAPCAGLARPSGVEVTVMSDSAKTVDLTWTKEFTQQETNNGASQWPVCMQAPYAFQAADGQGALVPATHAGTSYVGLLPGCAALPAAAPGPCVSILRKTGSGQQFAEVLVPGSAQDPKFF